jgi:hypothetical protein
MVILTCFTSQAIIVPDFDEEFTMNYLKPERNKGGFVCIHIKGIKEKKYIMDAFGIFLFLSDPRDIKDTSKMYAELVDEGKSVGVYRPSLPHAVLTDPGAMAKSESKQVCEHTHVELKKLVASVKGDSIRQAYSTLIHLPVGMADCNDFLNGEEVLTAGYGNRLKSKGRFIPYMMEITADKKEKFVVPYVYWKIPIRSTIELTDDIAAEHKENPFEDAIKSMSHNMPY